MQDVFHTKQTRYGAWGSLPRDTCDATISMGCNYSVLAGPNVSIVSCVERPSQAVVSRKSYPDAANVQRIQQVRCSEPNPHLDQRPQNLLQAPTSPTYPPGFASNLEAMYRPSRPSSPVADPRQQSLDQHGYVFGARSLHERTFHSPVNQPSVESRGV